MSNKVMGTPRTLVTRRQTAKLLKVSLWTLSRFVAQGLLQPVWVGKRLHFRRDDVTAFTKAFNGKLDLPSVANTAIRAFVRVQQCERRLEELMDLMGLAGTTLSTDKPAVLDFYRRAQELGGQQEPVLNAAQLFHFAKECLAITEEYFRLAEEYTSSAEPWRIFLHACEVLSKLQPRERFTHEHELSAAYGYVAAARRHVRAVAYFYVRNVHGQRTADKAFVGSGAFDPLITTLFPN